MLRFLDRAQPRWLILLLVCYLIVGFLFSATFPIFESWDEIHHYNYVRYLIEERRFPVQPPGGPESEFHQPPGYYMLMASLTFYLPEDSYRPELNPAFAQPYWFQHNKNKFIHVRRIEGLPWRGTTLNVHIVRGIGVLFGGAIVYLTYQLALLLKPQHPDADWFVIGAAGLSVFNATFLQLMSSVNNDVLSSLVGTGLTLLCTQAALQGLDRRRAVVMGVLLGAAALAKWTMVPFVGVFAAAVIVSPGSRARRGSYLQWVLLALLITVLVGGWWYVRNLFVYGEPLAMSALYDAWNEGRPPNAPPLTATIIPLVERYWSSLGATESIRMPDPVPAAFVVFTLIGLLGLGVQWLQGDLTAEQKKSIFILGGTVTGFFAATLVAGSQSRFGIQQRWLIPAHSAASVLLALGWWGLMGKSRAAGVARISWLLGPVAAIAASYVWLVIPAYAPPRQTADREALEYASPLELEAGSFARLIGVSVPESALPGSTAWTRVCWKTLEEASESYWFFIHLVGIGSDRLTGIDSIPGRGQFPTLDWTPGLAHCTDWPLEIPADAPPGRYTVQVGLYNRSTLERLQILYPDGSLFDPPIIGTLIVPAQPGRIPEEAEPVEAHFGDQVVLRGAALREGEADGSQVLNVDLFWEATAPIEASYSVFVHLMRGSELVGQADSTPRGGLYPTDLWPVGGLVPDTYTISLPADLPEGTYRIRVGLYDVNGNRLPGPEPDGGYTLPFEFGMR